VNPEISLGCTRALAKLPSLRCQSLLPDAQALTQLNWQPKPATAVWTQSEWTSLSKHLHNGNPATHFVMGFRDQHQCKKYVRSKRLGVRRNPDSRSCPTPATTGSNPAGVAWTLTRTTGNPNGRANWRGRRAVCEKAGPVVRPFVCTDGAGKSGVEPPHSKVGSKVRGIGGCGLR
jgi:hypothetical protein